MKSRNELKQIRERIARESLDRDYTSDPLLTPILGPATITSLARGRVTVKFGDNTFPELTDVTVAEARRYLSGMSMGIACKYDHEFAKFKKDRAHA